MVVNVKSGQITPIGGEHTDECEAFDQIGRYWLKGARTCTKGSIFYRNWHTAKEQGDSAPEAELHQPYDLDTTTLKRLGPPRRVFVVGSSRVLSQIQRGGKHARHAIELRGPGSTTRRFPCRGPCHPSSIAGGLALWLDGESSLRGYALT
jgi:hypothetical protein